MCDTATRRNQGAENVVVIGRGYPDMRFYETNGRGEKLSLKQEALVVEEMRGIWPGGS